MPHLQRTNTIYINSKYRTQGTASAYTITLPQTLLDVDYTIEKVKISLLDFSCYYNWFLINTGFNTITFHNLATDAITPITIPQGSYRFQLLAAKIHALYPDATVTWREPDNKLVFQFADPHRMTFDSVYETLGFNLGEIPEGTTITSTNPLKPMATTHIYINLDNMTPVDESVNLDNLSGEVKVSNLLARVPINVAPFRLITYTNQVPDDNGIDTNENSISRLDIRLTNADGVELTYLPEHELTLRFQVYSLTDVKQDELYENVREITESVKDIFLLKSLKK